MERAARSRMGRVLGVIGLLLLLGLRSCHAQRATVAVVGAGIGGAAAAHFLQEELGDDVHITVFERRAAPGGRTAELRYGPEGDPQELGASMIYGGNRHVIGLAAAVNLTLADTADGGGGGGMGIWDGARFVLTQTGQPVLDLLRVVARYGLAPVRYGRLAKQAGRRFASIYRQQEARSAFGTPRELLEAMGLWELTQQGAIEHIKENLRGVWSLGAGRLAAELAGAVDRVNYNQDIAGMNALAALVSYLPAADPSLFSIRGGNAALPKRLLEALAASGRGELRNGTAVKAVARRPDGRYGLTLAGGAAAGPFDAVVIATPLEASGLALEGLDPPPEIPKREFQLTVTTYVTGALNTTTFTGVPPGAEVYATAAAATKWSSISPKGPCAEDAGGEGAPAGGAGGRGASGGGSSDTGGSRSSGMRGGGEAACSLFKVFSRGVLTPSDLASLFTGPRVVDTAPWLAYPRFDPPERFAPFALAPGLVYSNALENAASAMEVSAVSAKNSALLVAQHLEATRRRQQQQGPRQRGGAAAAAAPGARPPAGPLSAGGVAEL